jgi:hypothetical protein
MDKLEPDPDPHQFAYGKPKFMEYERQIPAIKLIKLRDCTYHMLFWGPTVFEHFFKGLNLYLEARIRIRSASELKV